MRKRDKEHDDDEKTGIIKRKYFVNGTSSEDDEGTKTNLT